MDKQKPIVKHKPPKHVTVNTNKTVPTGYALEVYNTILQQEAEAARVEAEMYRKLGEHYAADAAQSQKDKCKPEQMCKCGTYHDAVNLPTKHKCEHDAVDYPSHYCQGGIECIDAIEAAVTGLSGMEAVCAGNTIKYVWRYHQKNGAEDLKKARFYLNKLILMVDKKERDS